MKLLRVGLVLGLVLLLGGCETSQNPVEVGEAGVMTSNVPLGKITLPSGATLTSATLYVYQYMGGGTSITAHRITADWDELTVTWSNFNNQYDATVIGVPVAPAENAWRTFNVTSLVSAWLAGTYSDYGILLKQEPTNFSRFHSSEYSVDLTFRPYLELNFDDNGTPRTEIIQRPLTGGGVADTYISEVDPTSNHGYSALLLTGLVGTKEKFTLIKFDGDFSGSCTRTIGYWKTHGPTPTGNNTNMWPVTSLTLGSVTYSDTELLRILKQPVKGNGLVALAHQLIGAKLNVANGANDAAVAAAILTADAMIGNLEVPPIGGGSLAPGVTSTLVTTLTNYNEGIIGPGHCGD
jgi:hypothetical protein